MSGEITPRDCPASSLRTRSPSPSVASRIGDPDAARAVDAAKRIATAWIDWLRTIRWSFMVTGTFTNPVNDPTAWRIGRAWISGDRWIEYGGVYAALGVARGARAEKHHVHALVGVGMHRKAGCPTAEQVATRLRGSWVREGHALVEPYTPKRGGVRYMVDQTDVIEVLGDPERFRPRKRGRRGG